jgi:hypothetical protein
VKFLSIYVICPKLSGCIKFPLLPEQIQSSNNKIPRKFLQSSQLFLAARGKNKFVSFTKLPKHFA